jgi:esterase/lipase
MSIFILSKSTVMKNFFKGILMVIIVVLIVYLVGPEPHSPILTNDLPALPGDLYDLEKFIAEREKKFNVKPDNEARFLWENDSLRDRTEYALLYLPGFTASWYEGYPANTEFADRYNCNAYFPRLAAHGIDTTEAMINMTPDALWESAKEALVAAQRIGKKVVVMGTSTGGTLALKLAAEFPQYVHALILYSPNIAINNPAAFLLSKPWGLHIARMVYKSKYRITNEDFQSKDCQYWICKYRLEAIIYLQQLLEKTMKEEVFGRVTCPVFLGYYYKDEENQDEVVRVDAMLKMFEQLGTPVESKIEMAFPEAGNHVIACELHSGSVEEVKNATFDFAGNIVRIPVFQE